MIKWTLIVLSVLALTALVVHVWGSRLPREHVAESARMIAASPDAVASWIFDVERHPEWRKVARVDVVERAPGAIRYREHGPHGVIAFHLRETEPGRAYESTIDDPTLPFGGRWLIAVAPSAEGARVVIREEGFVKPPVFRFLTRYVFGHAATIDAYLDALAARARAG